MFDPILIFGRGPIPARDVTRRVHPKSSTSSNMALTNCTTKVTQVNVKP